MPIYEYRCEQGHTFEVMQRITDDPVASCQTCSAPVQRVFHPVAVHFKGSGFYSTDYGSRNKARELKDAAEGNGKQSKDGDGSSTTESGKTEPGKAESSSGKAESSTGKAGSSSSKTDSTAASSSTKSD